MPPSPVSDEERTLWQRYRQHPTPELRNHLAQRYAPLLHAIATNLQRTLTSTLTHDDLVQYGYLGYLAAEQTYNHSKGAFTTHAYKRIEGAMRDGIRTESPHTYQNGKRTYHQQPRSLSIPLTPTNGHKPLTLLDTLAAPPDTTAELNDLTNCLFRNLNPTNATIAALHLLYRHSFSSIAATVGLCQAGTWKRLQQTLPLLAQRLHRQIQTPTPRPTAAISL